MRLIKSRQNALSGRERLVAGKTSGNRTKEKCALCGVLQPAAYAETLQVAHIQNDIHAVGARRMEVDWQKQARDADLVVFKTVVSGVRPSRELQRYLAVQLLADSRFKLILRVGAHIADPLIKFWRVVADEACQQGILNRRRRHQPIVSAAKYRIGSG